MSGTKNGKPLRFFISAMVIWVSIRTIAHVLTPDTVSKDLHDQEKSLVRQVVSQAAPHNPIVVKETLQPITALQPHTLSSETASSAQMYALAQMGGRNFVAPLDMQSSCCAITREHADPAQVRKPIGLANPEILTPTAAPSPNINYDHWQATAWFFWRKGSAPEVVASQGRLGGSQIGGRLSYDVSPQSSFVVAPYFRASAALESPTQAEAAVGIAVQPIRRLPITVMTEQRIPLDSNGQRSVAMIISGGISQPLSSFMTTETYIQTGLVGMRRLDKFVDGKASALITPKSTGLRMGMAISGGAQPSVSRLDVGPELQWRLPLPQTNARAVIEWRQRIAGHATPRSGLALTLAADF